MPGPAGKSHRGPNISHVTSEKILLLMAHQLGVPSSDPAAIISAAQEHKDQIDWAHIGNSCNIQKQLARKHFNEVIKPRYESSGSIMDINDRAEFTMYIASLLSSRCYPSADVLARFSPTSGRKYSRVILRRAFHNVKKCRALKSFYANLGYTFSDLLSPTSHTCEQNQLRVAAPLEAAPFAEAGTGSNYAESNAGRKDLPPPAGPRAASSSASSNPLVSKTAMSYPKFMSNSMPSLSQKVTYVDLPSSNGPLQSFTVLANLSDSPIPQYNIDTSYNVMRSIPVAPLQQQQQQQQQQYPLAPSGQPYLVFNPAHSSISPSLPSHTIPVLAAASSLEQDPEHASTKVDGGPLYGEIHASVVSSLGDSAGHYSSTFSSWESNDQPCTMSSAPSPYNSYSALPCVAAPQAQTTWTKPPIPITPNQALDHLQTTDAHPPSVYSGSLSNSASACSLDFPAHPSSLLASDTRTSTQEELHWSAPFGESGEGEQTLQDNGGADSEPLCVQFTQQNYTELSSISSDIFLNLPPTTNPPDGNLEDGETYSNASIIVNDPFSLNEDPRKRRSCLIPTQGQHSRPLACQSPRRSF